MNPSNNLSGPYTSATEFYGKLLEEYADVRKDPNSARHMANFVMTAYHLAEWTWEAARHRLPDVPAGAADARSRCTYFRVHFPDFDRISDLANGTKHCVRRSGTTTVETGRRGGAFSAGFSAGFDIGSLQVEDGGQLVDFGDVAERVMGYWSSIFC